MYLSKFHPSSDLQTKKNFNLRKKIEENSYDVFRNAGRYENSKGKKLKMFEIVLMISVY